MKTSVDLNLAISRLIAYGLEREQSCSGVDAKTGAPVREERGAVREPLSYDDLAKSPAKADIEKLAQYGAGYAGGITSAAVDGIKAAEALLQG